MPIASLRPAEPSRSPLRAHPEMAFDASARVALEAVRHGVLATRAAAQTDLFRACAVLACDPAAAQQAYAETLARCLAQALGQRPTVLRPGSHELTFDEAWLARAFSAVLHGDTDSLTFLVHSRIPRHARRHVTHLIQGVATQARLNLE